jgi:hypothetical protein
LFSSIDSEILFPGFNALKFELGLNRNVYILLPIKYELIQHGLLKVDTLVPENYETARKAISNYNKAKANSINQQNLIN